jgi:hypothetical protein
MSPVVFEPTISAGERPKTYASDRAAAGTGKIIDILLCKSYCVCVRACAHAVFHRRNVGCNFHCRRLFVSVALVLRILYLPALAVSCWKIFSPYIWILPLFFYILFYWARWNLRVCLLGRYMIQKWNFMQNLTMVSRCKKCTLRICRNDRTSKASYSYHTGPT